MSRHLQLLEAVERDSLALFLGADLPRAVTGLPSRTELARGLAERHSLDATLSLAQVAQRVGRAGNRFDFTDYLRRELDTAGKPVPPYYQRLVTFAKEHPLPAIITTTYDDFLERALRDAGVPFDRIVRGSDVAFARPDRLAVIKLYGDVQMPDTLVVTEDDHYGLWRDRDKENLLDEVRSLLKKQTILFLGYNLSDPDFHLLWREVLDKMGRFARTAYAVWPGLPEGEVSMWRDRMIQVIDADPWGLVQGQERANFVHPTVADLRQFREKDYDQLLTEALHDVWVFITGDSPLLKPAATESWKAITSRSEVPEEIDALFRVIYETRELARGNFTELTVEQLQSARQGIGHILEFLQMQFPKAGVQTVENNGQTSRERQVSGQSKVFPPSSVITSQSEPSALKMARRALAILEEQAAGFGALHIPAHLRIEVEEKRREVAALETQHGTKPAPELITTLPPIPSPVKGQGAASGSDTIYHGIAKAWAVLVGINHYEDPYIADLKVCVDDVTAIHQTLAERYQAARLLTDATPEHLPTRANILSELSVVAQAASEDDLLLFYFSGHGMAQDGESYLLARDTKLAALKHTTVAMKDIREIIEQSPAHAKVIVLDACHSGASIGKAEPTMTPEFIQRVFEEAEGMAVLASCKQGQQSWEWEAERRSVFTYYLLEALDGKADFDGKGFVTVSDTARYVTDGVKKWAVDRGVPQTPTLQYTVAGDIVLLRY